MLDPLFCLIMAPSSPNWEAQAKKQVEIAYNKAKSTVDIEMHYTDAMHIEPHQEIWRNTLKNLISFFDSEYVMLTDSENTLIKTVDTQLSAETFPNIIQSTLTQNLQNIPHSFLKKSMVYLIFSHTLTLPCFSLTHLFEATLVHNKRLKEKIDSMQLLENTRLNNLHIKKQQLCLQ